MKINKENYQKPVADIIIFKTSDVIATSSDQDDFDPYAFDQDWDV